MILSDHVASAVANLDKIQTVTTNSSSSERRAHSGTTRVFLTAQVNCEICVVSSALQTFDQIDVWVAGCFAFTHQHLSYRIDCHATGNVAGKCAAHAVRD